ncbi:MAG: M16 family metallopeptidase [Candidatus Aminicenantales bacterium]
MISRGKMCAIALSILLLAFVGCKPKAVEKPEFKLDYEKYTLKNGLEVVLHEDKSDPIVSVAVQYHVGSNREVQGRTGFAHLFEHMMFQESQHVGQDQFFKKIQEAGGTLNGGTSRDGTIYFQVVPKNALEMVLWFESDRLGFLLPTITQEAFANQQSVVKNEKRQGVDNRPYGHTNYVIGKLLYPEDHPYNWQVIGSMEDLTNATLKDVHDFHRKWYRPNNATLVVAGDFDKKQTKEWIEKYFGEIESGEKVEDPKPWPVTLDSVKKALFEDNFAKSPELNMVYPTVEEFHSDSYALTFLARLVAGSKKAPLYKVIVEEKKLAPSVSTYQMSNEITGEFRIRIRTFPGINLNDVHDAVFESFQRFETDSFTDADVERIKTKMETSFYNGISSILSKSFQLAYYNEYAGSPGFITKDLENIRAVTKDDILRVYETYIKGKPYVVTSFVPKGQAELGVEGSEPFPVPEEAPPAEAAPPKPAEEVKVEPIPSSFDRSVEPPKGPQPEITLPAIWKETLANGLRLYGIEHKELPLVQFSLKIKGGQLLDELDKVGVANLVSDLMMEGTKTKTPVELEEAIDDLGANIFMYTGRESITISANCLASKFHDVYRLVEEILLEPRWDEKEFERIKKETIETINRNMANPSAVSYNVFHRLVYGDKHIFSRPIYGTKESVEAITIDDLKAYYEKYFSPSVSHVAIVGDISQQDAVETFRSLEEKWPAREIAFPEYELPSPLEKPVVYFVDFPGARQSVIRIGGLSLRATDPDYYPAYVMNYKLGGSFNSIVNMILREEKGYTYGARTGFSGYLNPGTFSASSSVQSGATRESVQIFRDSMLEYREGIPEEDLKFTKDALIKSNARRFETLGALVSMLNNIALYNLPEDYVKQREEIVRTMTLERHRELAQKYIDPDRMVYLVVGDAASQMKPLEEVGLGKPILIERE